MIERGITERNCRDVVSYPDSHEILPGQGHHGGKRKVYKKKMDGKTLSVVVEVKNQTTWITTAYYE